MGKTRQQLQFFKSGAKAFGGSLMTTRKGREGHRPLSVKSTMHLVMRSTRAVGDWSFRRPVNSRKVSLIIEKFSAKYGVRVLSLANVGNHLHLQIKLGNRHTYQPFIRAITAAIAMAVTGRSRWNKGSGRLKFWDRRPFTRIVQGFSAILRLRDYIEINKWQGEGYSRREARLFLVEKEFIRREFWSTG